MRIFITAKPSAKERKVEETGKNRFTVWVKEPPKEGRANTAVLAALAEYLHASKSSLKILSGRTSRNKVIEIG